jgi:hypothetical protein
LDEITKDDREKDGRISSYVEKADDDSSP